VARCNQYHGRGHHIGDAKNGEEISEDVFRFPEGLITVAIKTASIMSAYNTNFYLRANEATENSARLILEQLFKFIPVPKSAVDVGAGVGHWLEALAKAGTNEIQAVEGDWVRKVPLRIPLEKYCFCDLKQPLPLAKTFDLAMSLEVAEHLPERCAEAFVNSLGKLSDCVLFSAAIPGQGGTHHVNEQWQQYWVNHFARQSFDCFDCIRPLVWDEGRVRVEYRQNILLFVRHHRVADFPGLMKVRQPLMASVLHPDIYRYWGPGLKMALKFLYKAMMRRLRKVG
jgi:hypothetical protein